MFPYANDAPAKFAKLTVYAAVASLVAGQLLFPKRPVAGGDFAMAGTAMPKTTVHENCQPLLLKNKIRFAKNILVPAPASDAVLAQ